MKREADRTNRKKAQRGPSASIVPRHHFNNQGRFQACRKSGLSRLRVVTPLLLLCSTQRGARSAKHDQRLVRFLRSALRRHAARKATKKVAYLVLSDMAGTAKLNAHVLTERLPVWSLLPNKLRCLLEWKRANRCFSGKPCGSCRVICSLSHARLRGSTFSILYNILISLMRFSSICLLSFLFPVCHCATDPLASSMDWSEYGRYGGWLLRNVVSFW